jgi:hypothetical protein
MNRFYSILMILVACVFRVQAQDSIVSRIVLIGDAGALVHGQQPVINGVRQLIPLDSKTTVVFLGDNLYKEGLPDDQLPAYLKIRSALDTQVGLVNKTPAKAYFIPGNHDWDNGGAGGYDAVLRQQRYIDQIAKEAIQFYPKDGCPGPVKVDITEDVVLVMMDSQWWLHANDKPGIESDCAQKTKEEVLVELEDILAENDRKLVLFAAHHPFKSNGIHGGFFTWKQHLFPLTDLRKNLYIPLPLIGSIYPISRGVFGSRQDLPHPEYAEMIRKVTRVLKAHPYVVFLAGHEHTLQYFADSGYNYVVAGSGCISNRVEDGRTAEFVSSALGFATLDISLNKNVQLSFYTVSPDTFGLAFRKNILNFTKRPPIDDTIDRTLPLAEYQDSVLAPASMQYRKSRLFKRTVLGNNYRSEWSTPVMFKMFNINTEKGGFTITGRGGGKQTKSLQLLDKDGVEWVLRTIDKDPEQAIPENFRGGAARDIVQDMISASFPYGPLIVPTLAKAAGVTQADPEIFFVPDDPALGYYRELFAYKICFLERKDPVPKGIEAKNSLKIINNLLDKDDHVVDQTEVLRARLLDIFIGDWDRHMGQWKWAVLDTGKGKLYHPIPKDRDMAFFYSDGLALKWASRRRLPFMRGFRYDIPKVNWMGFSSRDFDRFFMNGLGKKDWEQTLNEFTATMTDDVLDAAVRKLPREIYPLSGDTIVSKLKSRRSEMYDEGMKYYKFLARDVNITGSNKQEYFNINSTDTGTVIQVYVRNSEGDTTMMIYNRLFDPKITKEIRIYGFNGNDHFNISGKKGIRFRLIGGKGVDTFQINGRIKTLVYDLKSDSNYLLGGGRTKNRMSDDPDVNAFSLYEYQYDTKSFPKPNFGFNSEDGLMLGIGFARRTHGFRSQPYESDNKLTTLYSFFDNAYNIRYRGEFNHVFRKYDLLISSDYYNPVLNNFFGLGNNTKRDPEVGMYYYRVRYKYLANDFQVRKRMFNNKLGMSIGPSFYHYWMRAEDNFQRILSNPESQGFDSAGVYGLKTYLGGKFDIDVNNLNSEFNPTRGVLWNTELRYFTGLNNNSTPLFRLQSDMTVFASLSQYEKLLAILRIGGGHIFSDNYEFFQALNLGANNFLRGFRKNRFSGSSLAYGSIELRYKLFTVRSPIMPGSFGVVGFDDIGRVWARNEVSRTWHNAFGGGVYYTPFDIMNVAITIASSEEETLTNFTAGARLNLYF